MTRSSRPALALGILVGAFLATGPKVSWAKGRGLAITIARPDRVLVDGEAVPIALVGNSIRWRGLDLKTADRDVNGVQAAVVEGNCVRVEIGLAPGTYSVDADACCNGTLEWMVGDSSAATVAFESGEPCASASIQARVGDDGVLSIFWKPEVGYRVGVRSLRVLPVDAPSSTPVPPTGAAASVTLRPLPVIGQRPAAAKAAVALDPAATAQLARARLREACEFLVRQQLSTGFFDYNSSSLWEVSVVCRCLLLGSRLLNEPKYAAAADRALDVFAGQQAPDGGFCALAYSVAAGKVVFAGADCPTRNVADLSFATGALSLAARTRAEADTSSSYVAAHRKYLDEFASQYALPDGSYRNGLFRGGQLEQTYTVATAAQVSSLVAFYRASKEAAYLERAAGAARALLSEWSEAGRPRFHEYGQASADPLPPNQFHNLYYIFEALLAMREATLDDSLRHSIANVARWYFTGPEGLLAQLGESRDALSIQGVQDMTKGNAMLGLFHALSAEVDDPRLTSLLESWTRDLLDPARAKARGVCAFPYDEAGRKAVVATAFAGLSYAELAEPGSPFR